MADFKINNEGSLQLISDDISVISGADHIKQKIYICLMNFKPEKILGKLPDTQEDANFILKAYVTDYFYRDPDINPMLFEVELQIDSSSNKAYAVLYYKDDQYEQKINIISDMKYNIKTEGLVSYDDKSTWLNTPFYNETEEVVQYFINKTNTNEVLLKREPDRNESAYLYYETENKSTENKELDFVITVYKDRINYSILSNTKEFNSLEYVVEDIVITNSTVIYNFVENYTIRCNNQSGVVEGKVKVVKALSRSNKYELRYTHDQTPVFPVHHLRGKYYAIFDKNIMPGNYKVIYRGFL